MYALHSLYSPLGRFATLRLDRQIRLDLNTYNTYFSALCIIPSISYTCFATSYLIFRLRLSFPPSRDPSLTIVSDRDKLFMSQFWKALHKLLGIEIQSSTSYHLQTDGSSERSNKTVIQALLNYVNQRQTDWAKYLVHVETAINNSVNATMELTPI